MKKIYLFLLPIIFSCSLFKSGKKNIRCIENEKFKKEFFNQINYVENNISTRQDSLFINSLIFISNYTQVSFQHMMNYSRTYPTGVLEKDKKIWLEWYKENKCNNIQLKEKHLIPEQYKEFFEY